MRPRDPVDLQARIANRTARVCVVGLGYVGLTVACALARTGFHTIGIDTDASKVDSVRRGAYPLDGLEPGLPELLAQQVGRRRLEASGTFEACAEADVILVVVQTPVDPSNKRPTLDALRTAVQSIGAWLKPNTLVVVESTIPPGTMRDDVVGLLERSSGLSATADIFVACCPERVMPGKLLSNLTHCSRVIGGWTPSAGQVASTLYQQFVLGDLDLTDCLTAELVKTTENAYRDVQIAFANEVALLCEQHGADVYNLRELVNKSPFRTMHMPGAGVGGHCIPKDPWLLVAGASAPVRLIPAARAINDSMPAHVGELAAQALREHQRELVDSRIVVLGYTYLEDSADVRNSPTVDLVQWLQERGAHVSIHDPFVPGLDLNVSEACVAADCLILMVAHTVYRELSLPSLASAMRTRLLVDGRHVFGCETATSAGFVYRCVGIGTSAPELAP